MSVLCMHGIFRVAVRMQSFVYTAFVASFAHGPPVPHCPLISTISACVLTTVPITFRVQGSVVERCPGYAHTCPYRFDVQQLEQSGRKRGNAVVPAATHTYTYTQPHTRAHDCRLEGLCVAMLKDPTRAYVLYIYT